MFSLFLQYIFLLLIFYFVNLQAKLKKMRRHTFFYILFLVLASTVMSLASCDDTEEKRRLSKEEKRRLQIEDSLALKIGILPTADCDFLRLADSLHIFDTLGVDVHFRHYRSLSESRYALNHDMVEGAVVDSVLAEEIEKKDEVALILGPSTALKWKFLTAKKSRILRHDQLVDKVVATDSHGASRKLAMNAVDSITKKKKPIYFIQCEDVVIRCNMLTTGNVDAAMLPEPYAAEALKSGARQLALGNEKSYGVIAFRAKALKDKRIKEQFELFEKGCKIAKDSLQKRR